MSLQVKSANKISYSTKKFFQKEVPKLSKNEYYEIFNIIKLNADATYSENSAGVYINLKYLNEPTIEKIMDFIKYSKCQKNLLKSNTIESTSNEAIPKPQQSSANNIHSQSMLSKTNIEKELSRLRDKKKESFVFQNFLDKLSISNIKQFNTSNDNDENIIYPQLKHEKIQFNGVKARLLKKCRDVNKTDNDLPFIPSDDIDQYELENNDTTSISKGYIDNRSTDIEEPELESTEQNFMICDDIEYDEFDIPI